MQVNSRNQKAPIENSDFAFHRKTKSTILCKISFKKSFNKKRLNGYILIGFSYVMKNHIFAFHIHMLQYLLPINCPFTESVYLQVVSYSCAREIYISLILKVSIKIVSCMLPTVSSMQHSMLRFECSLIFRH